MLQRKDAGGLVLISQPAHAWVSGQLARSWGNEAFGPFVPWEEVCAAATLHDIGFLNWELAPVLNRETGLPYCFRDLPTDMHFDLWSKSVQKMMRYGRYPALLVSLHFSGLCEKHRKLNSPKEFELKKAFLSQQDAIQTTLETSLSNDFYYEPYAAPEILERNRTLISVWDWMSLAVCLGFDNETSLPNVPLAKGTTELTLTRKGASQIAVQPWPFAKEDPVHLICEGRRILSTFTDEKKMREALRAASPIVVQIELVHI